MILAGEQLHPPRFAAHCEFAWSLAAEAHGARAATAHIPADGRVEVIWTPMGIAVGGHVTRPVVHDPRWRVPLHGVQLRVGRAGTLLGAGAAELTSETVWLSDIWGREADLLAERVAEAGSQREANDPSVRVPEIAAEVGYSERQLRRRFQAAVGFGPKLMQRIERLQRFVRRGRAPAADVARIAVDLGYSDESHLRRDALELGGTTPAALLAELP